MFRIFIYIKLLTTVLGQKKVKFIYTHPFISNSICTTDWLCTNRNMFIVNLSDEMYLKINYSYQTHKEKRSVVKQTASGTVG
jgi:hypothetical protein